MGCNEPLNGITFLEDDEEGYSWSTGESATDNPRNFVWENGTPTFIHTVRSTVPRDVVTHKNTLAPALHPLGLVENAVRPEGGRPSVQKNNEEETPVVA